MTSDRQPSENHVIARVGWLRAAVLGANDGLLSTASLITGVAAAATSPANILLTGVAGLAAGAMSMAAGEYVSVSSQSDAEAAERGREARELKRNPQAELHELANIYVERGLDPELATEVARQLMARDPVEAHLRDELGITDVTAARPVQASLASAAAFTAGAVVPIIAVLIAPRNWLVTAVFGSALVVLTILGAAGAKAGGAPVWRGVWRVFFWGALAMAVTTGIGRLFGVAVG